MHFVIDTVTAAMTTPVDAMGAKALFPTCDISFTCDDYKTHRAHPWSPFPPRRAHPGPGPHNPPEEAVETQDLGWPHGGVRPFHQKSSCLHTINFRASCGLNFVTPPPHFVGPETLLLHRVVCREAVGFRNDENLVKFDRPGA